MNKPRYIILHHSGIFNNGLPQFERIDAYHKSKGWGGCGYHLVLESAGDVIRGREDSEIGAHCKAMSMNYQSIGICVAGDMTKQTPTVAQIQALNKTLDEIQERYDIPEANVLLHREVSMTACPAIDLRTMNVKPAVWRRYLARLEHLLGIHV